jgi:PEP-CTERM motif
MKIMRWLFVLTIVCVATVPARSAPIPGLFNTGVISQSPIVLNAEGNIDLHYLLVSAPPDPGFSGPASYVATVGRPCPNSLPCWIANGPDSEWISSRPDTWTSGNGVAGNYDYQLAFDLTGFDPSTAFITGQWATDNEAGPIRLNGGSTGSTTGPTDFSFFTSFTISSGFVAGVNTLDFPVVNDVVSFPVNPTGLRVEFLSSSATPVRATSVPEPTTLMLLTLALAGLTVSRRGKLN